MLVQSSKHQTTEQPIKMITVCNIAPESVDDRRLGVQHMLDGQPVFGPNDSDQYCSAYVEFE